MSKMPSSAKFLIHVGFLFVSLFINAQTYLIEQLHTMQVNPRLKEKVYVHTNKTSYFPDDIIWFKAYVGDSLNQPSLQTQVLEVKLFDGEGAQVFDRTVAILSGTGHGQIALNDAIAPGTYYLQARTNYMRNFGEDHHYLQKITILGQELPALVQERQLKYDVQLLPEGGNLIEDVENILGIKAMLDGRGVEFQGTIFNNKGDTITTFQSQHEGLSSCKFFYTKGESYRAQIQLRDTLLVQDAPTALAKGVSLSVDNSDEEYLRIRLKTNEATFYNQQHSSYTLLYHQDRQLFQLVSVARLDSITGLLKTNKNIFLDGVITATLFADDKPVAERKFYIETDRKKASIYLEKSKIDTDSVTYGIVPKGKKKNLNMDLSVSVLSKKSKAVDIKNTIKSAFLLSPYVRGYIENPAYYFDPANEKRKEHLDLLLLTQGWTGYTLDELVEEINPDEKYTFEKGFELKGTLQKEAEYNNLVLIPNDLLITDKVALKGQSKFVFQNLNVFKGDTVRVAYQDGAGKIIKPSKIEYDTTSSKKKHSLSITARESYKANDSDKKAQNGLAGRTNDAPFENVDGTIDLDEVIVTERRRSEQYLQRRKIIEKYEPLVSDIGKYYDIPLSKVLNNPNSNLMDFLVHQGFSIKIKENGESYLGGYRKVAHLFINGMPIRPEELPTWQLPMENVENTMVNNLGFNPATGVSTMIFQVFTSDAFGQNKNTLYDKFVVKNGFDRAKKYFTPLYTFEESRPLDLLEIDWKPCLKTNKNGEVSFKIARKDSDNGLLFEIQGFSSEGHLISKTMLED